MSVPLPRTVEPGDPVEPGDAELIEAVRSGDLEAYGLLYRRHAGAATTMARQLTGSRAEADDLVAEAFARVLDMLRSGGGPDTAFRGPGRRPVGTIAISGRSFSCYRMFFTQTVSSLHATVSARGRGL